MEVDTWTVEYEPMDVRNHALYLEVATAGGSYWKSNWWVTAISSYLTADGTRRSATTRQQQQQRDNNNNNNFWPWFTPPHIRT